MIIPFDAESESGGLFMRPISCACSFAIFGFVCFLLLLFFNLLMGSNKIILLNLLLQKFNH